MYLFKLVQLKHQPHNSVLDYDWFWIFKIVFNYNKNLTIAKPIYTTWFKNLIVFWNFDVEYSLNWIFVKFFYVFFFTNKIFKYLTVAILSHYSWESSVKFFMCSFPHPLMSMRRGICRSVSSSSGELFAPAAETTWPWELFLFWFVCRLAVCCGCSRWCSCRCCCCSSSSSSQWVDTCR